MWKFIFGPSIQNFLLKFHFSGFWIKIQLGTMILFWLGFIAINWKFRYKYIWYSSPVFFFFFKFDCNRIKTNRLNEQLPQLCVSSAQKSLLYNWCMISEVNKILSLVALLVNHEYCFEGIDSVLWKGLGSGFVELYPAIIFWINLKKSIRSPCCSGVCIDLQHLSSYLPIVLSLTYCVLTILTFGNRWLPSPTSDTTCNE